MRLAVETINLLNFAAMRTIGAIRPADRLKMLPGFVFVSENWVS